MATVKTLTTSPDWGIQGATRLFTVKVEAMGGLAAAASPTVDDVVLNPFGFDVVIVKAIAVINTEDAQDGDIDIGLADDAAGANVGAEIVDSLVNSAKGALDCLAAQAVTGTPLPIWRKSGTGTDSYIASIQRADANAADLDFDLVLLCIPLEDMN